MSPDYGGIDQGIFIIRVCGQLLKQRLPHPALAPAHMARMDHPKIAKALRHVSPGQARAVSVQHRFHKQPVILRRPPHMARSAR